MNNIATINKNAVSAIQKENVWLANFSSELSALNDEEVTAILNTPDGRDRWRASGRFLKANYENDLLDPRNGEILLNTTIDALRCGLELGRHFTFVGYKDKSGKLQLSAIMQWEGVKSYLVTRGYKIRQGVVCENDEWEEGDGVITPHTHKQHRTNRGNRQGAYVEVYKDNELLAGAYCNITDCLTHARKHSSQFRYACNNLQGEQIWDEILRDGEPALRRHKDKLGKNPFWVNFLDEMMIKTVGHRVFRLIKDRVAQDDMAMNMLARLSREADIADGNRVNNTTDTATDKPSRFFDNEQDSDESLVDEICSAIQATKSEDELKNYWLNNPNLKRIKDAKPALFSVIEKAKDNAKARFEAESNYDDDAELVEVIESETING